MRIITLFVSLLLTLSFLFYYKYAVFAVANINRFFGSSLPIPQIVLPIGISFFTFQSMSYVIDVYRREIPAQKNPLKLALYVSLFPQLIAGPIVRYVDVYKQIDARSVNLEKFASGVQRFIVGLGKKVLLANILGETADKIFAMQYGEITAATAWLGAVCYTMQIYFDFSGYSDMAIGLGRMFGFEFLENFRLPYISTSITEFWRRWHISLSTWFRDYVYIPLGGNRRGNVYIHLLIVFVLTGFWHGAAWNFLFWGLWHGFFLILERVVRAKIKMKISVPSPLKWLYAMLVVLLGWVLFRADSLSQAWLYLRTMFGAAEYGFIPFDTIYYLDNRTLAMLIVAAFVSSPLPQKIAARLGRCAKGQAAILVAQKASLLALLFASIVFIANSSYNPFIYFRF